MHVQQTTASSSSTWQKVRRHAGRTRVDIRYGMMAWFRFVSYPWFMLWKTDRAVEPNYSSRVPCSGLTKPLVTRYAGYHDFVTLCAICACLCCDSNCARLCGSLATQGKGYTACAAVFAQGNTLIVFILQVSSPANPSADNEIVEPFIVLRYYWRDSFQRLLRLDEGKQISKILCFLFGNCLQIA